MKILIFSILPIDLLDIKGGVESATIGLLNGLKHTDNEVLVYSLSKKVNFKSDYSPNIKIEYRKVKFFFLEYFLFGSKNLRKILNEYKPDVIHIEGNGPYINIFKKIKNIPVVITPHAIFLEELKYQKSVTSKLKFYLKYNFERYFIKKFRNFIFISEYNKNIYSSLLNINKISYTIIPNPVNDYFFENSCKEKYENSIIYVGAINRRKNLISLLEVLDILKKNSIDFKLNVCGGFTEEDYKNDILNFLNKSSIYSNVKIHGFKSINEVIALYRSSSLFVLPSLQETLPVSICESLAIGCPVIATNVGGVKELIINGYNGFIYEPNDKIALAEILLNFHKGIYNYKEISNNAKTFSLKFKSNFVATKTLEFYKRIINV